MSSSPVTLAALAALAAAPGAPSSPEAAVRELITDLDQRRAPQAFARLGPRMQAVITADALQDAFSGASHDLGALGSVELLQTFQQQGMTGLIFALRYQHGGLEVTAAVEPEHSLVEGFFLKPLPADVKGPVKPAPPAPYVHPEAFTTQAVTVGQAPFALPGTLLLPKVEGRVPAVVLVHGSGPNDRDETIAHNKPFKDLAEGLASAGIAVLRYDKRTYTHGKDYVGKPITLAEEVTDDAAAAVALLAARPEVDGARVVVVGHSLGALLGPRVALQAPTVAGLVLLAPPARKPSVILPQQLEYLGTPKEKVAEVRRAFADLASGKATGSVLGAPVGYWKEWAATDGIADAKKAKKPVLVLRGERDYQVIAEDFAAWKKGLAGVAGAEVTQLPALNHLFIEGTGKSTPAEYDRPGHVAPVVIEKVAAFVKALPR